MSSRDFFCLFLTLFLFMGPKPSWSKEKPEKEGAPCPSGCRERPRVCFSPEEDCTGWITQEIDKAQKSVQVQAFSFTSLPIAQALAAAEKRGVSVEVILDRKNFLEEFTQKSVLSKADIPVDLDGSHSTAHNKVILIDGKTVITGSFNFTKAAQEKNAENLIIVHDPELAQAYSKNWQFHRAHSERLNLR